MIASYRLKCWVLCLSSWLSVMIKRVMWLAGTWKHCIVNDIINWGTSSQSSILSTVSSLMISSPEVAQYGLRWRWAKELTSIKGRNPRKVETAASERTTYQTEFHLSNCVACDQYRYNVCTSYWLYLDPYKMYMHSGFFCPLPKLTPLPGHQKLQVRWYHSPRRHEEV